MKRIGLCVAILGIFAWCGGHDLAAQTPPAGAAPAVSEYDALHAAVKTFFENISDPAGGPKKGLEEILKSSPLTGEEKEKTITALSNNIREISLRYGTYLSFESIGIRAIGRDLVVLRYLYKCQNYPVVWYFTFYRPTAAGGDTASRPWLLVHFYYDSNLNIPSWESDF